MFLFEEYGNDIESYNNIVITISGKILYNESNT